VKPERGGDWGEVTNPVALEGSEISEVLPSHGGGPDQGKGKLYGVVELV